MKSMKPKVDLQITLVIVAILTLFHVGILIQIIPYKIVWGGRLETVSDMYKLEGFSLASILLLGWLLFMKGSYVKVLISPKIVAIGLWAFFVLFALSTLGNLLAVTYLEKSFSIVTLSLCLSIWRINKE